MISIELIETPAFLVDVLPDGGFVYRDGNRPLSERTGLGRRLIKGMSPQALLPEPLASAVIGHYEDCVRSVAVLAFEEQFEVAGTSTHWRTTLIPIHDGITGRVTTLLGIVADITEAKRTELNMLRANARLSLALQAVQGAHWEYEVHSHSFEASPSLALLLGAAEPRPVGLGEWIRMIPPEDRQRASFHTLVDGTHEEQVTRFRIVTPEGEERWLKCRRLAVRDSRKTVQIIFGVTVDITADVLKEQRLTLEAERDGLTGLLNRRGFLDRLGAVIADSEASGASLCVAMLDLDRFKAINDTRGHAAGDAVLAAVGQRIEEMLRPGDFAARLGGDEFALALRDRDPIRARRFAERLRKGLERPCSFRDQKIPVFASVGSAMWNPGQTVADAMEGADRALYSDKHHRCAARLRDETPVLRRSA